MSLQSKLQTWQNDLLDMSRRNNLLYYGVMRGARGVRLLGDAGDLFRRLAGSHLRSYQVAANATDIPVDCEKRLTRMRARAREAYNDRGTHVLYVAFGMLRWKESAASDEIIDSPLVLVPVELKREGALGTYSIVRAVDEEIAINPALAEKFRHDFSVQLPSFAMLCEGLQDTTTTSPVRTAGGARETQPSLESILTALDAVLHRDSREVVAEVHLGIFSFQKLVMYQDLRHHTAEVLAHPLLRLLGGERLTLPRPGGLYSAEELDRMLLPRETLEILDADSSQQEAIVAAKAGASFVLRGPPGTGKSQTISNIIAECLGVGRSVLFVSEKRAALEVVGQRLSDAGLGEFLLNLHSHSADKKQLITDIALALAEAEHRTSGTAASDGDWERASEALARSRSELNDYSAALHLQRAPLDRSAWDAYGALARLATIPDSSIRIADVGETTRQLLDDRRRALEELLAFADVLDRAATHPWRDATVTSFSHELEGNIRAAYTDLCAAIDALGAALRAAGSWLDDQEAAPPTFAAADRTLQRAELAVQTPRPPRHWLEPSGVVHVRPLAIEAAVRTSRYHTLRGAFDLRYAETALALNHDALLTALDEGVAPVAAAILPGPREPHAILLDDRAILDETLTRAMVLLPDLAEAAEHVAQACHLPGVETIGDISAALDTANWLLGAPDVPRSWLEPSHYGRARPLAIDAREMSAAIVRQRAALFEHYTEALFALDMSAIATRFRTTYRSPLRYVRPAYYADIRTLRTCLRQGQSRSRADLQSDVFLAERLHTAEETIARRRLDYATALGHLFDGECTDWQRVSAAVQWADALRTHYPQQLPPEIVQLIGAPARTLKALAAQRDRLRALWDQWQECATRLERFFAPERMQDGITDLADAKLTPLCDTLQGWSRVLSAFWQAADSLTACREPQRPAALDWPELCTDLGQAREIAQIAAWFDEHEAELATNFGPFWQALATDWDAVHVALRWTERFAALYSGVIPESAQRLIAAGGESAQIERVGALSREGRAALARIAEDLDVSDTVLPRTALLAPAATLEAISLTTLRSSVAARMEHLPELERWVACGEQRRRCEAQGLGGFVAAGLREGEDRFPRDLAERYEKRFYQIWLDAVLDTEPELRRFRGELHEQLITRFSQRDERHLRLARTRLRAQLAALRRQAMWQALADTMTPLGAAYNALRREVAKKRHPAIRQIVRQTGPALVRLKPCWMMSPLSISQYVESGEQLFDVVIFDEASQVCPEDAICAIFRGPQLIVVGDEKQLPPTRFFAAAYSDDNDEDEEGAPSAQSERTASILEECDAAFPDRRMLCWHYRSRHESLIAFSNAHFYHNALQTFPGPQTQHAEGVRFEYVSDGVYDRGGSHTNKIEAARVVDLAIEHLLRQPSRDDDRYKTLGIVTMSQSQQQAVRDEIERRLKRDRTLSREVEYQLEENDDHGFFVKNLESVQGDERDVIVLSIGYGYDAPPQHPGRKLTLNFGPVNREGGERRLNVAVTRAREQVVLVASIRAADLPPNMPSAGARKLRDYLAYAEQGPDVLIDQVRALAGVGERSGFDSPFEQAVYDALSARGLTLTPQVGCAGYYIDLAVRDASHPGRYVLGIECDGATYHSAKTARDRDRLRQQQLERLGWQIHRIWSRDWVHDQAGEIEKVFRVVDDVRQGPPPESTRGDVNRGPITARTVVVDKTEVGKTPVEPAPLATRLPEQRAYREVGPATRARDEVEGEVDEAEALPPLHLERPLTAGNADTFAATRPLALRATIHICEACAFYQFHTASRFYCGHDAAYKLRDPGGRTAGCPVWRRRA